MVDQSEILARAISTDVTVLDVEGLANAALFLCSGGLYCVCAEPLKVILVDFLGRDSLRPTGAVLGEVEVSIGKADASKFKVDRHAGL